MATKDLFVKHTFGGGWATDFGPYIDTTADAGGTLEMPFLVDADNCIYELDGGPHKMPGADKLNSSTIESGAVVKGLYDYWRMGTAGMPTQQRIVHAGTKILADAANGTFSAIQSGMTSGAIPSYATLEDVVVMVNGVDANVKFDGTTASAISSDPGVLGMVCTHKNRMFGAGKPSSPSTLFYCANLSPDDWLGAGSGSIDIDPQDGDVITGIASHKNDLWVFKGPYKGSIHRITGSSSSDFARTTFIKGLGAVWHNLVFPYKDDLGFVWSDGTVHSLNATADYGDFYEASLSRPINLFIREHVNLARLKHGWAVDWPDRGIVLICLPIDGATNNTLTLMMDYRFGAGSNSPHPVSVRWAPWPAFTTVGGGCLASVTDATAANLRIVMAGGSDGYVRKLGRQSRTIDTSTAITFKVTTPFISYATPIIKKSIRALAVGIAPKNNLAMTVGFKRDSETQQTVTVYQGGSDVLGTVTSSAFTLDSSTLGGSAFLWRFSDDPAIAGEFRSIQYQVTDAVAGQDVELHALSAMIQSGAEDTSNG